MLKMNNHPVGVYLQIFSICCCLVALIVARTSEELRVTLPNGSKLVGRTLRSYGGRSIKSFLGVPYARPPVGDLRFKVRDFYVNFFIFNFFSIIKPRKIRFLVFIIT